MTIKNIFKVLGSAFSLESDKASNEAIRESIMNGASVQGTNLFILMLAIFIASIGLNMNSTAVIIGAMLISPLMGGIMAIGYGMATNDIRLVKKAFMGLLFQVIVCVTTSAIYFSLTPISTARSELLARTTPTIWDVMIAFFGGIAGIIAVTRREKTNVIPGVAIATALMPPLCTAGYGIAMGVPKYFFGAFYLFFINSFFICISTVIIIRIMRIPKKSFIDEATEKRVQRYIYLIALIIIVPSIYLGYQIVKDTVEDSNIANYIGNELIFDETQVVRAYADKKNNQLKVALVGKRISQDTIDLLENKLQASPYYLSDYTLRVTQTESPQGLAYEDIQALIEQELDATTSEIALGDRDKEIEMLRSELVKYKAQVMEYEAVDYDVRTLIGELQAIFPNVIDLSIGRQKAIHKQTGDIKYTVVGIVQSSTELTDVEQKRIANWIGVKTNAKDIKLIVEVIPPTPMPTDIPGATGDLGITEP